MALPLIHYICLTFESVSAKFGPVLSQVGGSENQNAKALNFDLSPDLDLTRDLFRNISRVF